jgi:predicted ATPase
VGVTLKALATHRPLGLLVEDLHWADASTLDVLEHLLCRGIGVSVVGTFRLDDPATAPATEEWRVRVMRLAQVTTLELRPLSRDETAEPGRADAGGPDPLSRPGPAAFRRAATRPQR